MNVTLDIADENAARCLEVAHARGLTVERWILELADTAAATAPNDRVAVKPLQAAADIVLSHMRKVPSEVLATMPEDGASQHDHYIYGWPKKDA